MRSVRWAIPQRAIEGLAIAAFLMPLRSMACDICSVFVARDAQGISKLGFYGGLAEQYTHYGTLMNDGVEVPNPSDQYLNSSNLQLGVGANVSDAFGVQATLPWIRRTYRRPTDEGSVTGIGDLSLLGKFVVLDHADQDSTLGVRLIAGLKLPTGDSSRLNEELQEEEPAPGEQPSGVHGHDLALGTGSWDFIVGADCLFQKNRFELPLALQYAIRTRGTADYRYANEFTWQINPSYYLLLEHQATVAAGVGLSGEVKGKDDLAGKEAEDTGVTNIFLGPSLRMTSSDRLSAAVIVELPVLRDYTAFQIVPNSRIRASFTLRF